MATSHPDFWAGGAATADAFSRIQLPVSVSSPAGLDDNDPFDAVLLEMVALNRKKRADYANNEDPFSNFREAAEHALLLDHDVVEVLIGVKNARLRQLAGRPALNESVRDSLIDRAVYSVIAVALYDEHASR